MGEEGISSNEAAHGLEKAVEMQSQLNQDRCRSESWALSALGKAMGGDGSTLAAGDQHSFRSQELVFASLNLMLIGALLVLQEISRLVKGKPAASVIFV